MEDLVDLSDDVDTYGNGEEDVADDEDRAEIGYGDWLRKGKSLICLWFKKNPPQ
ncbi:hypothetical protein NC651_034731 [Populus alba x Populus x berolinensis]|nr:hypothetical protein NC651_034731 [Populus alba x Populus x berolinensis]